MSDFDYPEAERLDLIDVIHGTPIADPYRWLEDPQDARTTAWSEQQDRLYDAWLRQRLGFGASGARETEPGRGTPVAHLAARLRERLATWAGSAGSVSVPVRRGERLFSTRREPDLEHPVLSILEPTERALIDPAALDPSGTTTLDGWFPSADGALLAYFLSVGGDESPRLRVMDVASGEDVDGPIDGAAAHALAWLPDGTGFYYQRRPTPEQIASGILRVHVLVYLHRLGTPASSDLLVSRPGLGLPASSWFTPAVSPDGRWLRLDAEWGTRSNDVYLADLTAAGAPEAPVFTDLKVGPDAKTELTFGRDGRMFAHTFRDAPNGRLYLVDPRRPEYEHWRTLLPEDPGAVLRGFAVLEGEGLPCPRVLALRSRHALSELTLHDFPDLQSPDMPDSPDDPNSPAIPDNSLAIPGHPDDPEAAETGETPAGITIELPGLGTVRDLVGQEEAEGPFAYFSYTDFVTPPSVYRVDGRTGEVRQWAAAPGHDAARADAGIHVRQLSYPSYDGTEVRMFILSPTGEPDRPRPTILYGYGAHGNSREPAFNPLQLAWVESGGVYAIANIRGGGEEGEAWHRAGIREHRQNTFADFHAAGDHLVHQGWTTRDRLGIHGGSAGGQMVGVALAQRPDAYRAVLCSAPQLDMLRAESAGAGALWTGERGTVRDPVQFGWLLAQSPYHMVREGTAYPAVLLTVFDGDARVATWHARKFAAALQHATSAPPAERPILLRREAGVGHAARAASRSIALWSEQLGFFAAHLGLTDAADAAHAADAADAADAAG